MGSSEGTRMQERSLSRRFDTLQEWGAEGKEDDDVVGGGLAGRWSAFKARFKHDVRYGPLVAAVAAPMSTLLDIPALSERWYTFNGESIPDPGSCLVLSAVGLGMNCLANLLLLRRFTIGDRHWLAATILSVICWCIKLVIAIVNLSLYGATTRNGPGFAFAEGFWCAVASCAISGVIAFVLLLHLTLGFDKRGPAAQRIRVAGAEFIVVVMGFVLLIGLEALAFSRLEGWSYFTGIYFSVVTVLTIGLGDVVPTTTAARILLFPFAVGSIALLAVIVGIFVDFLSQGSQERRRKWRKKYEDTVWSKSRGDRSGRGLTNEIRELKKLEAREEYLEMIYQLFTSALFLAVFWVVGATVFWKLEGFTVGTSLYFCYIFFLTIGYGDVIPKTPGGRVFFIVYAIIAVPFVTNFVLNTVSAVISSLGSSRFRAFRFRHLIHTIPHHSHAHYVAQSHERLSKHYPSPEGNERALTRVVLGLALRLESQATALLIDALEGSGRGHILLRADRNLQRRALDELKLEPRYHTFVSDAMVVLEDEEGGPKKRTRFDMSKSEAAQLDAVLEYRRTFAALLATGSVLMGLEKEERLWFERRLEDQHVDHALEDSGNLEEGRDGLDEEERGAIIERE